MSLKLKKLKEQVIVITGASSGIGLSTARMAAKAGARLVLAARSENALRELADEITAAGGQAMYVVADVSEEADVRNVARAAVERFGGFDTWVNNAAVGMYGKVEEIPVEDMKRLFDTNLWGLVYGSREAVLHLRRRGGGALINVGSTVSERAIPLQGVYSATKHAVKAITDALRMELEAEGVPIAVTLIKPGPIDTPFPLNAKNYLATEPKHVPPVYAPETVAHAILHCAEHPVRDVFVGSGAKGNASLGYHAPHVADKLGEAVFMPLTKSEKPPLPRDRNALDRPSERLSERGDYEGHVKKTSLYTEAALHPALVGALFAGAGMLAYKIWGAPRDNGKNGDSGQRGGNDYRTDYRDARPDFPTPASVAATRPATTPSYSGTGATGVADVTEVVEVTDVTVVAVVTPTAPSTAAPGYAASSERGAL